MSYVARLIWQIDSKYEIKGKWQREEEGNESIWLC
jgi:hypothetical protein